MSEDRNLNLVSEMGRADTNGYLAMLSNACSALRNGGQPARAVGYVDSHTLKIAHQPDYGDMPSGLQACWALSRLQTGATQTGEATVITAAERAEQGGVSFQAALMRASAVNAALARGDLTTAEARWAPLAADEARRLAAHEKGTEVVRLLFVQARLEIARQQPQQALRTLADAAALISARHQAINPDARELAALRSTALLAGRQYPEAAAQAQAAVELATSTAIAPASSAWIGEALLLRARAEAAQGSDKAAGTARQALRQLSGKSRLQAPVDSGGASTRGSRSRRSRSLAAPRASRGCLESRKQVAESADQEHRGCCHHRDSRPKQCSPRGRNRCLRLRAGLINEGQRFDIARLQG